MSGKHLLLVFVDGFGIGGADPATNPLADPSTMPQLTRWLGGQPLTSELFDVGQGAREWGDTVVVPIDVTMGVDGLPQSATGQTALFTGVNAARAINRHLHAYPSPALAAILEQDSIFKRLTTAGLRTTFLNAYSRPDYEHLRKARHLSASTLAVMAAGLPFRSLDDLRAGRAVAHDISGQTMHDRGYKDVPLADPRLRGQQAASVAMENNFTLFEFFVSDKAGHAQDRQRAVNVLGRLDTFLAGLEDATRKDLTLLLTSDHGNVEDLSTRSHTTNRVPALLRGPGASQLARSFKGITSIAPAIIRWFGAI